MDSDSSLAQTGGVQQGCLHCDGLGGQHLLRAKKGRREGDEGREGKEEGREGKEEGREGEEEGGGTVKMVRIGRG